MRYFFKIFLFLSVFSLSARAEMGLPAVQFGLTMPGAESPKEIPYEQLYPQVDEYAKTAPESRHLDEIVDYLVKPYGADETLKARALFAWIVYHMNYDSFKAKNMSGQVPDGKRRFLNSGDAFKTRIGVCGDFADLFVKMANRANLKAKRINGVAGYQLTRQTAPTSGHAWNAVRINKKWQLLDVTWAMAGDYTIFDEMQKINAYKKKVRERRRHTENLTVPENRKINNIWFLTKPEVMIETHFPDDIRWELLDKAVSPRDIFKENEHLEKKKKKLNTPIKMIIPDKK